MVRNPHTVMPLKILMFSFYMRSCFLCIKVGKKLIIRDKSSHGRVTNVTPVSLLEVKVALPTKVIFGNKTVAKKFDTPELAQLAKVRLGEGTLGSLFKVVLDCGSTTTMRMVREGLVDAATLEFWINFFGGIRNTWLLPMHFSFWYGGEAFILYEYLCLGSLEELLHGSEGLQYTPLSWRARKHIAVCAAKAVAFLHTQVTKNGEGLVCGVIKSSNVMIQLDFSACLSGYETPYLVPPATIIRRNAGRIAPELRHTKVFTQKSDVYSFGILLLELTTGKKPAVTNLGEYIWEKRKQERLKGIYDKRMGEILKENMVEMLEIAQLCLTRNPRERPAMDRVLQMVQDLQD
ncbi:probable inactive receptor kinase At2g26730 [Pistacia vera]|uniref:probable inactive receptor kinase At2g26730 n=1 Tax=Pistacia vera TaxID=55513 RepID=UPI0012635F1C|nr:probable inactive receptor kinase At2g26730 [Pistacia vera]